MEAQDYIGKKFGRLTIVAVCSYKVHSQTMVKCQCECGNTKITRWSSITSGRTKSCGCYKKEVSAANAQIMLEKRAWKPNQFKKGVPHYNHKVANTGYHGITYCRGRYACTVSKDHKIYSTTKNDLFKAVEWVESKRKELYGSTQEQN